MMGELAMQVKELKASRDAPASPTSKGGRPACSHCHKPGHTEKSCFTKHPEKGRAFREAKQNADQTTNLALKSTQDVLLAKRQRLADGSCFIIPSRAGATARSGYIPGVSGASQTSKGFARKQKKTNTRTIVRAKILSVLDALADTQVHCPVKNFLSVPAIRKELRIRITGQKALLTDEQPRDRAKELPPLREIESCGMISDCQSAKEVDILVDTGAMANLISGKIVVSLHLKLCEAPKIDLILASGARATPIGMVEFFLTLGTVEIRIRALVVDDAPYQLVIGSNFLRATEADVSFTRLSFKLNWQGSQAEIPLLGHRNSTQTDDEFTDDEPDDVYDENDDFDNDEVEGVFPEAIQQQAFRAVEPSFVALNEAVQAESSDQSNATVSAAIKQERIVDGKLREEVRSSKVVAEAQISSDLSDDQREQMVSLLEEYNDCFTFDFEDLGASKVPDHRIRLKEGAVAKNKPPFRRSPRDRQAIEVEVTKMLEAGVIVPVHSPWGSPVVVVPKKDGGIPLYEDYG